MERVQLATQRTKDYSGLDYNNIMPLYDYHPWNNNHNPRIDRITHTLLNLKNADASVRRSAVSFFTKVLKNNNSGILSIVSKGAYLFGVVPSHTQEHVSPGLMELMANVSVFFGFTNTRNLLSRTHTVPKAATGGPRTLSVHMNSIQVVEDVAGQTVFLFDDITSTGSSLLACKQLLLNAGASRVVMIALGQTSLDH